MSITEQLTNHDWLVLADRILLCQALNNVSVSVTDQGLGMNVTDIESAFQSHTQLSVSPTIGEPSHGMSLSSARKAVEAMNSIICIASQDAGFSTTFTRALPQLKN